MDNPDRVRILEDEANEYISKVEDVPLLPIDRYRLVYYCLEYLRTLGYRYDIDSMHRLVIVNYYHEPDIELVKEPLENLYQELDSTIRGIALYDADRQSVLFHFREMIFGSGIKVTYRLGSGVVKVDNQQ